LGVRDRPQDGLAGRRIYFPRGKVVGGSSAMNAMMWIPGDVADFDGWPDGWHWDENEALSAAPGGRGLLDHPAGGPNPMSVAFVDAAVEAGG